MHVVLDLSPDSELLFTSTPLTGAPITNLTVQVLSATAVTLSWSHPPPQLTITLSTYHIQYGFTKSSQRETLEYNRSVNFALFVGLEEATQYQFSVFGVYGDDVEGVEVIVTVTTNEDSKSHDHVHDTSLMTIIYLPLPHTHTHTHAHTHTPHTHTHLHSSNGCSTERISRWRG